MHHAFRIKRKKFNGNVKPLEIYNYICFVKYVQFFNENVQQKSVACSCCFSFELASSECGFIENLHMGKVVKKWSKLEIGNVLKGYHCHQGYLNLACKTMDNIALIHMNSEWLKRQKRNRWKTSRRQQFFSCEVITCQYEMEIFNRICLTEIFFMGLEFESNERNTLYGTGNAQITPQHT